MGAAVISLQRVRGQGEEGEEVLVLQEAVELAQIRAVTAAILLYKAQHKAIVQVVGVGRAEMELMVVVPVTMARMQNMVVVVALEGGVDQVRMG